HAQVPFQSDYLTPIFSSQKLTTTQTVTKLGKILLGDTSAKLPMYCSEFAWHMLALSSCTADDITNAPDDGASCVDPMFDPMPIVSKAGGPLGLGEGPLASLMLGAPETHGALVAQLFAEHPENAAHLSSGHVATQTALKQLGVITALNGYYAART